MRKIDPALVVVLGGVSAALHVGKLAPALPVLSQSLHLTLVQGGFLLSLVQLAGMTLGPRRGAGR
jgi:MFS transporter, CP family, cyanate transporter